MGVRGLTTFIANRSRQYLERYELHDCYLVVDGNSIACQLYSWHSKCNDCFGGDYDKYAIVVDKFFKLLLDCNITPLVVFDGAYEDRKLKTVYSRMKNKIGAARDLNSVTEGRVVVFPLLFREAFLDVLLKLQVKCIRCDFEGDSDAAFLAKSLKCPILSYDSDFYIFDVLYVPFSTVDLRLRKKNNYNYVACEVYKVDKFLNSFGGLNKVNLPLLAVLLGNDYIKKSAFSMFYSQLKMQGAKNDTQRVIKSVIEWLKHETPESALRKILGRYKLKKRKKLAQKIQKAIEGYQCLNSQICSYFNFWTVDRQDNQIVIPKPEEIELAEDAEEEDNSGDSEDEEVEPSHGESNEAPAFFQDNFRNCLYPSCFMDMMTSHTYYCIPQIEDYSSDHSHTICLEILAALHKILTHPSETQNLTCVARIGQSEVKRFSLPFYNKAVPRLVEIENMDLTSRKKALMHILNIEGDKMLLSFPSSWHLFLITLKYWVTNAKSTIDMPYVYSTILCGIVLNYVDGQAGFYRSTKSFCSKYSTIPTPKPLLKPSNNIKESINAINIEDSISCVSKLITYFQMDAKMKTNVKLFDRNIIQNFAMFQSCLLHIKHLNTLLNFPFPSIILSNFYDGTFLYNMTTNLLKRTDLKSYMQILLGSCPRVLNAFELMTDEIKTQLSSSLGQREPPKKRKKKRSKKPKEVTAKNEVHEVDEEYVLDSNNIYSLLSFLDK